MSIVKNYPASDSTYGSNTSVTIIKLRSDAALASPPLPDKYPDGTSYTHPLVGFLTKYYLDLTSYWFRLDFYPRAGESIIIKASLASGASGIVYGLAGNSGRYIKAEDGNLNWYNGTTIVLSKPIDGKVHCFGYTGYDDEGTLKCRPFYDGEDMSQVAGSAVGGDTSKAVIGGSTAATPSNILSGMRLYEIAASSYPSATDTSQYDFHYYAALHKTSPNNPCLMETRYSLTGITGTGTSVSAGNFPSVGYGVQLHDIKHIANSGYNDLVAILCDDDGIDGRLGWKNTTAKSPCVLSKSGETNRNFAINLGSSQNHIPIPSGWTLTPPSSGSFAKGELISGRKLKWDMWMDDVKFGKYAEGELNTIRYAKFNLFKENTGESFTHFNLERFDGYNTGKSHLPAITWNGNVKMEYHNSLPCKLTNDGILMGHFKSDEECIFAMHRGLTGDMGIVKLGNLPLWNYTISEQNTAITEQTGLEKLQSIGGGVLFKIYDYGTQSGWHFFGSALKTSYDTGDTYESGGVTLPKILSSDSSADTVALFRDNGFSCDGFFRDTSVSDYMRVKLNERGYYDIKADLILTMSLDIEPSTRDIIDCSNLVAPIQGALEGVFDSNVSIGRLNDNTRMEFDRIVVGEEGGVAKIGATNYLVGMLMAGNTSNINVAQNYNVAVATRINNVTIGLGYGFGFGFALKALNSSNYLKLFGTDSTGVFGYIQMYEESKNITNSTDVTKGNLHIAEYDNNDGWVFNPDPDDNADVLPYIPYYQEIIDDFFDSENPWSRSDRYQEEIYARIDTIKVTGELSSASVSSTCVNEADIIKTISEVGGEEETTFFIPNYVYAGGESGYSDKISIYVKDKTGKQTEAIFNLNLILSDGVATNTNLNVVVKCTTITDKSDNNTRKIQITVVPVCNGSFAYMSANGIVYNYADTNWSSTLEGGYRTINSRQLENRYYGFTKAFDNDDTDSTQLDNYYAPVSMNSNWGKSTYVQPWGGALTPANKQRGGLIFYWKDLYQVIDSQANPALRPDNPITSWVRIFNTTNGPHAWDLYGSVLADNEGHKKFNLLSENPYISIAAINRWYMFHNNRDRLIENNATDTPFVDAYMTIWDSTNAGSQSGMVSTDQQTLLSELNGKTIILYVAPLNEPITREQDNSQIKFEIARFSFSDITTATEKSVDVQNTDSNHTAYNGWYTCKVTSGIKYWDYTRYPLGVSDPQSMIGQEGMYHIEITPATGAASIIPAHSPYPGDMYYIDIIETPVS
jgi:hypothetical protein